MHLYEVDEGVVRTWVVANDKDDALKRLAQAETNQDDWGKRCDEMGVEREVEVTEIPDDKPIGVIQTNESGMPTVIKTAAEWVAEGPGVLACTEW